MSHPIGEAFSAMMWALVVLACIAPLGLWKLGEVIWWLATHVQVTW